MSTKNTTPESLCECTRIITVNEVLGTRSEVFPPQPLADAMSNHGDAHLAVFWIEAHEGPDDGPIGCCLHKNRLDNIVTICWYPIGSDIEAARVAMREVLSGDWRRAL